jgi:hypothetical protein
MAKNFIKIVFDQTSHFYENKKLKKLDQTECKTKTPII